MADQSVMNLPFKPLLNVSGDCFDYVRVYSDGFINKKHGDYLLQHSYVRFQVQLFLMVSISHAFHRLLFERLCFPRLTSDAMAGLVLGRSGLEYFFLEQSQVLFPPVPNQVFGSLLKIGYVLFTFLTAVRLDTNWLKRIGKRGVFLGILVFSFPHAMIRNFQLKYDPEINMTEAGASARIQNTQLYLTAFAASQFVDVSVVLMQLNITNSRLGHLALATTMLGELAIFVYQTIAFLIERVIFSESTRTGAQSLILLILFLGFIIGAMRALSFWFIRITPEGKPIKDLYVHVVVATVLIMSSIGDGMGLNYLWGPFVLGLIIPAGSPLATSLTTKLDTVVYGLLIPLLSTFCATKVDLWATVSHLDSALNFQLSIICYLIKMVATFIFVLLIKLSVKEALALTLILNVKGTQELGTFMSYTQLEMGDLDSTSGVLLVFLLTSYAPPLIKLLYDPSKHYIGYRKKCIQYTPYDAKLDILACAHKQEDAMAAIKLFEITKPTKGSPISVYGLCLEELVSSNTPLIINHQLGQKSMSNQVSRSHSVIDIFKYFKTEFKKTASVNLFTAISPIKQMHEDICWLAFDKTCSLIVLPFHKKWNSNGKVVSNSTEFRNLNISVFDRGPCSVAVLIDRRRNRGLSSIFESSAVYHVATLFVGGADDREALAYALRMSKSPEIRLTVMRFTPPEDVVHDSWENMFDSESLRNLRLEMAENITYIEETVRDGSDTAAIIRSIQGNFDLIMVGRRHETNPVVSGLSQWTDYPELGPIGDLLASSDIVSTTSVLVMQQQILKADHSSILN